MIIVGLKVWVIRVKDLLTRMRVFRSGSRNGSRSASGAAPPSRRSDPEKVRELESLRLAKAELERQAAATTHPVRKQQIQAAIAEIDKRLAAG